MANSLSFNQKLAICVSVMLVAMIMSAALIVALSSRSESFRELFADNSSGGSDEDLKRAEAIIKENPLSDDGYGKRAGAYFERDEFERALTDYNRAIELAPKNPEWYHRRGHFWYYRDDSKKAAEDFSKAIELEEEPGRELFFDRGEAYAELHDYSKALADYDKAARMDFPAAVIQQRRGLALLNLSKLDKAFDAFNISVASPDDESDGNCDSDDCAESRSHAQEGLSQIYIARDDFDNALKCATAWIDQDSDNEDAFLCRAQYYKALGQKEKELADRNRAISVLTEQIDEEPSYLLYSRRGLIYQEIGKKAEAKRDFEEALALTLKREPANQTSVDYLRHALGQRKEIEQRIQKKIENLNLECKGKSNDYRFYDRRAGLYFSIGKYELALRDFRQAQALKPEAQRTSQMVCCLVKLKRFDEAVKLGVGLCSSGVWIDAVNRSLAFEGAGRHDEAIEAANQAIKMRPVSGQAYYCKGKALEGKGEIDAGKTCIRQAIALGYTEDEGQL